MPWLSIITALLSFLMSKASGASTGKSAAIAAAAGLGAYYLADPANPDNLLGLGTGAKATPGDVNVDNGEQPSSGTLKTVVSEAGSTLRSWGPMGTLGVVAGTTAMTSGDFWNKYGTWVLIGGAALLLLRS